MTGTQAELTRIAAAIEPLVAEQASLRSREQLLLRLLQSFDQPVEQQESRTQDSAEPELEHGSVRDYVRACAVEILRDAGRPVHINDLHAQFLARGFRVPGAGRAANLTAHLGRIDGIASPRRGYYSLSATNAGMTPKAQRRKSRRKKSRRTAR